MGRVSCNFLIQTAPKKKKLLLNEGRSETATYHFGGPLPGRWVGAALALPSLANSLFTARTCAARAILIRDFWLGVTIKFALAGRQK